MTTDTTKVWSVPATVEDALRLAIKLAVDAGDYDRAAEVLELVRRSQRSSKVSPIWPLHEGAQRSEKES